MQLTLILSTLLNRLADLVNYLTTQMLEYHGVFKI